nr:immunoglobulin heavy chain junction region [Mus musculus]
CTREGNWDFDYW